MFLRRPGNQAQFSAQLSAQVAQRAPLREVQQWIAEHPADDLSVEVLAARASLSPRHFARAFAAEVGMTPGRYVERVRLEAARRQLEDTAGGVEQTARACGYRTPEAMRRAFIEALGVSPAEYRRRFRPVSEGAACRSSSPCLTGSPPSTPSARTRYCITCPGAEVVFAAERARWLSPTRAAPSPCWRRRPSPTCPARTSSSSPAARARRPR